jgi:hypothetical protein
MAGCINPPVANKEPEGLAISAFTAISMANETLVKKFDDYQIFGNITFQNLSTFTSKWKGDSAGNATSWTMSFKAILINDSSYYYIEGWAWLRNPEGRWQVLTGPGMQGSQWINNKTRLNISASGKLLPVSQLNMTMNDSYATDLKKMIASNDSNQIYKEATKYQRKNHPINRVSLYVYNGTTIRRESWNKIPIWEIEWKYQWGEKSDYFGEVQRTDHETVILNAMSLTLEEQK